MKIKFSEKLIEKLRNDKSWITVMNYLRDKSFFKSIILYATNWKYRSTRNDLVEWLENNYSVPRKIIEDLYGLKNAKDKDSVVRQILAHAIRYLKYLQDQERWKVGERWQTPYETWLYKTGDCEDGAILIYSILHWLGIDDSQLYIVCGDVVGGGHCYVVYTSEKNGLEYIIDWCYYPETSVRMKTPYAWRKEYYYGKREWFRFNLTGSWKAK